MRVYVLINGRTRATCGVYTTNESAVHYAKLYAIDSWYIKEYVIDTAPIQLA
jgi:hypothetical protein